MTGVQAIQSVDFRSLCGIRGCQEKAFSLFAWPGRKPVPLCQTCRVKIAEVVNQMVTGEIPEWTPQQWLTWIREHGKEHLFGRDN